MITLVLCIVILIIGESIWWYITMDEKFNVRRESKDRRSGAERRVWNYYCDRCGAYMPGKYCDECDELTVLWVDQMKDRRTIKDRREK